MKHTPLNSFIQQSLPDDKEMPLIVAPNGARYGRELAIAITDGLDLRVNSYIAMKKDEMGTMAPILDIGGASGFRAHQMAEFGAAVTVIDLCDTKEAIARRNAVVPDHAPVEFIQGDVRHLGSIAMPARNWSLINMRRVIHWLSWDETAQLITDLKKIGNEQTFIALCFQPSTSSGNQRYLKTPYNYFYHHDPLEVSALMRESGYQILLEGRDKLLQTANYTIFARMPRATPAL